MKKHACPSLLASLSPASPPSFPTLLQSNLWPTLQAARSLITLSLWCSAPLFPCMHYNCCQIMNYPLRCSMSVPGCNISPTVTGLPLCIQPECSLPGSVNKANRKCLLRGGKKEHLVCAALWGRSDQAKLGGWQALVTSLFNARAAYLIISFSNVGSRELASSLHSASSSHPSECSKETLCLGWEVMSDDSSGPSQWEHLFLSSLARTFSQSLW